MASESDLLKYVIHSKKKLERNSDETVILNVVHKLFKISITCEILEATRIGKTIRNLSKRNDDVGEKAKILLNKWRKILAESESPKNSKPKSVSNEDNVEKYTTKQTLTQGSVIKSSQVQNEKHRKHSTSSKQIPDKHSDQKGSSKSSQSLDDSQKSRHSVEHKSSKKLPSPEIFSFVDKSVKETSSSHHSSSKRKLSAENQSDMNSHTKKIKSDKHSSSTSKDKKKDNTHVSKDKSQNSKKEYADSKSKHMNSAKQNSSSSAKKMKIQTSEEFTSSSVSFEDCLGFNDIVSVKKKKSSKLPSSTKKPYSDSVQLKKKPSHKKVTDNFSPCDANLLPESSCSSKVMPPVSIPKRSTMFDADKGNSLFYSDMQSTANAKERTANEDVIKFTSSRKEKTAIYSGRKNFNKGIPTLAQCCYNILIENIDILGPMGDTPYSLLKPVLEKCNPNQLFTIEKYNPHLLDDTNELWKIHCKRDFKLLSPLEHETWRDVYLRGFDEKEEKLKKIKTNIFVKQQKAVPVRQVKLAFIDSDVKPPRDVLRKQAKSRLLESSIIPFKPALSSKVSVKKSAEVSSPVVSNHNFIAPKNGSIKRNSESLKVSSESFRSESSPKVNTKTSGSVVESTDNNNKDMNMNLVPKKPKVAPLMAKTLKTMKQCFRR